MPPPAALRPLRPSRPVPESIAHVDQAQFSEFAPIPLGAASLACLLIRHIRNTFLA